MRFAGHALVDWDDTIAADIRYFREAAEGEIPPDFEGDGVGGVRWAPLDEVRLHSTDLRILTDAGLATFGEAEIEAVLARDGIELKVYR